MEYPPSLADLDLEHEILGSVLATPDNADLVAGIAAAAFTHPRLQLLHEAIQAAFATGTPPTLSVVRGGMRSKGDIGSDLNQWLTDLQARAIALPEDISAGVARLEDLDLKREIARSVNGIQATLGEQATTGSDCLGVFDNALLQLQGGISLDAGVIDGYAAITKTMEEIDAASQATVLPGLTTGSADLDSVLLGLRPGELIVVGARPSVGKTVVAGDFTRAALEAGAGVLSISIEMSATDCMKRYISADASIDGKKLMTGQLTDDEWARVARCAGKGMWERLTIVDRTPITSSQISALIRQQSRIWDRAGIDKRLVVVDYLQIMTEERSLNRRESSRQQALGAMCLALKNDARSNNVPLVALSQVNRQAHNRPPTMADLRESGDIEANADVILLLHREDLEDLESPRAGEIDFIVAKNRRGETKTVTRIHQLKYTRTRDMARAY